LPAISLIVGISDHMIADFLPTLFTIFFEELSVIDICSLGS